MAEDKSKLFAIISKIPIALSKNYEIYIKEKKALLNYPKVVQYLFNKPIKKCTKLSDLLVNYECTVKKICISDTQKLELSCMFDVLNESLYRHTIFEKKYTNSLKKYSSITRRKLNIDKFDYLPKFTDLSKKHKLISQMLDNIAAKYSLYYIYRWCFSNNNLDSKEIPEEIKLEQDFVYDFYVTFVYKNRLIQFVIEYDGAEHFIGDAEIHINDLFKQYVLFQMNIHLLRLNKKTNIQKSIRGFIKKIISGNEYVISNRIDGLEDYFTNEINDDIITFFNNYKHNHIVCLRAMDTNDFMSDDEDLSNPKNIPNYVDDPDDGVAVGNDFIEQIMKKKFIFTKTKKKN